MNNDCPPACCMIFFKDGKLQESTNGGLMANKLIKLLKPHTCAYMYSSHLLGIYHNTGVHVDHIHVPVHVHVDVVHTCIFMHTSVDYIKRPCLACVQGTSTEQDARFYNKQKKLLKQLKFPPNIGTKVDMSKVSLDTIKPWIIQRINALLGFDDDVVTDFLFNLLETDQVR